jgi:regulator of protease activity HflC (stomatin/prohibitin superfamily)
VPGINLCSLYVSITRKEHRPAIFMVVKMEKEYIIKEYEVGVKFVDGKWDALLKPGRYTFGLHPKAIAEQVQKVSEKRKDFLAGHFYELSYVEPTISREIHVMENHLKQVSGSITGLMTSLFGSPSGDVKNFIREQLRRLKGTAYAEYYANAPAQVREAIVGFDKAVTDAVKEPEIVVTVVDTRQLTLTVAGQEMLTNDKVSIRINVLVQYRVKDVKMAVLSVASYQDRLYQQVQMIIRDYAAANTLDQLLTNKGAISKYVKTAVDKIAQQIGLEVMEVGLKDIILPGEIREAMNRVVQAERDGKAGFIRAREEVATARAMANAAKIIGADPNILRLKQIEALKEIARSPAATIYFGVGDDLARALQVSKLDKKKA